LAVAVGISGPQHGLQLAGIKWALLCLLLPLGILPALAVFLDWSIRRFLRETQRAAAAGQIPPERAHVIKALMPWSDQVVIVKYLPVLLLVGGAIVGHFPGAAGGRTIAPAAVAEVGADFGALVGGVVGALAGALLAVGLLRLYRVEESTPWPGHGNRPYPRALAALYLSAAAALTALTAIWLL
jgi:hypothetical protein